MGIEGDKDIPLAFIPLGKQVGALLDHLMTLARPTWSVKCKSTAPNGLPVPWGSECPSDDVWQCMYGRAEGMASPRHCDCARPMAFSKRDLYLTLLDAIVLQGNRTSPLVPKGPALPPFSYPDGGVAVSVHVRGGDSCDIVVHAANRTTWGYWPFDWTGLRATNWQNVRRFCVHPSVHLATVRGLMASRKVRSVLLATDSTEAVDVFRSLEREGVELHLVNFDRQPLSHAGAGTNPGENWIEYRMLKDAKFAGHVMASAIEDVRHLARGQVLVAAMCSRFSRLVHGAMIAHNRREVEVVTLDKCQPLCDEELGLEYDEQMRWNFGPNPEGSQSQTAPGRKAATSLELPRPSPVVPSYSPPVFPAEAVAVTDSIEDTW